ncbi:pyridoxamine 5'-phosphate oxidase [Desulfobulbus alkaliphilus]|uniref:pyridoxamine 5'-phosphate oxidase n=1 Tax=Desulfobulbus alkaliphilus TaxID=869814 RepID=UPI0019650059|nr:pyridoxamine 5'-phosphate oxidase [Desulfobulbus alkaliphilus]MBM9535507.1 pyridoxamine 5'-phosphate oxidase [Desulfobulbus alkaliphilus]
MDIKGLRKEYSSPILSRDMLDPDPIRQFARWFADASASDMLEPNAMSLATAGVDGQPTLRTVLLKFFDHNGFVFFTNYGSRKARQIAANHRVALLFSWIRLERQVEIIGKAEKVSSVESARYFATRPRDSQIGAWISRQSTILSSRKLLMMELEKMKVRFLQGEIPLPDFWGGYRVYPTSLEFWQGQTSRLHDRFLYTRSDGDGWNLQRLAP